MEPFFGQTFLRIGSLARGRQLLHYFASGLQSNQSELIAIQLGSSAFRRTDQIACRFPNRHQNRDHRLALTRLSTPGPLHSLPVRWCSVQQRDRILAVVALKDRI